MADNETETDEIPASNGEGWDFFTKAAERAIEEARKRAELEQAEIDAAYKRLFMTPDGQTVLRHLQDQVEAMEDFDPAYGFNNGAAFGFWRTGQRRLLRNIKDAIVRGAKA